MASSAMIALLKNSRKVPPVVSARRSFSLVDKPFMKYYFFFSMVSTYYGVYCVRWLNNLE
jgi:hypothetical protein